MLLYVLSGLCCGIAAVMIIARTTTGLEHPRRPLRAGRDRRGDHRRHPAHRRPRHDRRLVLGVLSSRRITNLFILNNLATEVQNIAKGLIIVAAVLLQQPGTAPAAPADREAATAQLLSAAAAPRTTHHAAP